jgi:hypothetical protein
MTIAGLAFHLLRDYYTYQLERVGLCARDTRDGGEHADGAETDKADKDDLCRRGVIYLSARRYPES